MKKLLICASVAAMLAACSSDDEQLVVNPPVTEQGRTVTVTATLPTATRLALTEENNTIKVDWKESGETFAVVPTEAAAPATFTQTSGNQFTGTLTGSGPYYAFYPAGQLDEGENCSATSVGYSLKSQSGELDEAFTLMYAQSEDGQTFSFRHLTAIVKFTLSGLEEGSEVSDVNIASTTSLPFSGTVDLTTGTLTAESEEDVLYMGLADCTVATDGTCSFYAYLPPISKDNVLTMTLTTDSGDSYATTVQFAKDIEAGKYYRAARTVTKQPEAYTFQCNSGMMTGLDEAIASSGLTKVKFVAGSLKTSGTAYADDTNGSSAYIISNGDWLEVHTYAKTFQISNGLALFSLDYHSNFSKLTEIDLNTSMALSGMTAYMFQGCSALTSITFGENFKASGVTNMQYMFINCSSLTSVDLSSFDTSNVTTMWLMFNNCSSLTSLDLSSFNTSNVTTMSSMFSNCSSLTSLDLSSFNTSNVTTMSSMFFGCSSLTSLDLSSFNTSKVTDMKTMFQQCEKLESITFGEHFSTSSVTSMHRMFTDCSSLTSLDLSSFNTSNVTDMYEMFFGCSSLTSLDLSSFNTSNVTDMYEMFSGCSSLEELDLSSFTFDNITDYDLYVKLFANVGQNSTSAKIYVSSAGYSFLTGLDNYKTTLGLAYATLTVKETTATE